MQRRFASLCLLAASTVALPGCGTVGYYGQAIGGHLKLMAAREPIDEVIADDATDPALRARLETLVEARRFAIDELGLPDTDSYRSYVATGKRYVTWNVVAAGEFSLRPYTWCFPIAGCVNYRGYYAEADARAYAAKLRDERYDVTVGGASAYSTLGWFDDPVLDTMLRGDATRYVGTLFHEMAHQRLYVKDDSDFNEAYANFVEQEGVREWLKVRGEAGRIADYERSLSRSDDFAALLADTRAELETLYAEGDDDAAAGDEAGDVDDAGPRAAKRAVFEGMRARYERLKAERWGGYAGYDGWFASEPNNARLVSVATYRRYMPAFAALFEDAGRDIEAFHERARAIADLGADERAARMNDLLAEARAGASS